MINRSNSRFAAAPLLGLAILLSLSHCSDDNSSPTSIAHDTVYVFDTTSYGPPQLLISSPRSGDTVTTEFPVSFVFPHTLAVKSARVYSSEFGSNLSPFALPYDDRHPGEMTLLARASFGSRAKMGVYVAAILTNGDTVMSPVVTVSNLLPNVDGPMFFGEALNLHSGDTITTPFDVIVSFSDTLPLKDYKFANSPFVVWNGSQTIDTLTFSPNVGPNGGSFLMRFTSGDLVSKSFSFYVEAP